MDRFADWADRAQPKVTQAHSVYGSLLQWVETQPEPVIEEIQRGAVDLVRLSTFLFAIPMGPTGHGPYDKRKKLGTCRGLEFWALPNIGTAESRRQTPCWRGFRCM